MSTVALIIMKQLDIINVLMLNRKVSVARSFFYQFSKEGVDEV